MGKSDEGPFAGFPFLDHTLIPSRFVLKDMFDLTAWEIRMLLFFFYNLYTAIPCRFIDETTIIERFGSATQDLSDTQKATPNIIRVSLASLVKTGYLNVSRKQGADGKDMLFYSLKLDLRSRAKLYNSIDGYGKAQYESADTSPNPTKQFARIEVLEDRDIEAKSSAILKDEPPEIRQKPVTASHFSPPKIIPDSQPAGSPAEKDHSSTDSPDLSGILENNISSEKIEPAVKKDDSLKIDLPKPVIPADTPPSKDISKDFLSDLEDVISDMASDSKKNGTKEKPASVDLSPKPVEAEPEKKPAEQALKLPGMKKFDSPEEQRGAEIWEQVLGQMHILLDNMTFNTWLKPSEYYKYKNGVHLIKVESIKFYDKFIKQWGNLMQEVIMLIEPEFKFEFYSE